MHYCNISGAIEFNRAIDYIAKKKIGRGINGRSLKLNLFMKVAPMLESKKGSWLKKKIQMTLQIWKLLEKIIIPKNWMT